MLPRKNKWEVSVFSVTPLTSMDFLLIYVSMNEIRKGPVEYAVVYTKRIYCKDSSKEFFNIIYRTVY